MRWALIKDGVVDNIVLWDGEDDVFSGYQAIALSDTDSVSIGWHYDGENFIVPVESE